MKEITFKRTILAGLIILTSFVVIRWLEVWYWRYWPFDPATVHVHKNLTPNPSWPEAKILVTNPGKTVCAGSIMTYEVEITKKMDVPYEVRRSLVNSSLINYDPSTPPKKPLGCQVVATFIYVPANTDTHLPWFMRHEIVYFVGPNRREIPIKSVSEKFWVKDCSPTSGIKGPPGPQGKQGVQGDKGEKGKGFWGK